MPELKEFRKAATADPDGMAPPMSPEDVRLPTLHLTSDQLPELGDYALDEELELTIRCTIKGARTDEDVKREKTEDGSIGKVVSRREYKSYELLVAAGAINDGSKKKSRKLAEERGLDVDDSEEIERKRASRRQGGGR